MNFITKIVAVIAISTLIIEGVNSGATIPSPRRRLRYKGTTPSPTPMPTKGVRVKTTRGKGIQTKTPRTTRGKGMKTTRPRIRTKTTGAIATPMPTPQPTEQCDCVSVQLVSRNVIGANKCYRWEVDFCNDGINAITLGDGNADVDCGVDFMAVMTAIVVPADVTYSGVYDEKVRGLKLTGLNSGDRFRVCYDKNVVDNTLRAGFIEYYTDSGEFSCQQDNNLPDLCHLVVSNAESGGAGKTDPNEMVQFIDEAAGKVASDESMSMMIILWAAFVSIILSIIVSITVVTIAYYVCIKPSIKTQIYDKVDQKDVI